MTLSNQQQGLLNYLLRQKGFLIKGIYQQSFSAPLIVEFDIYFEPYVFIYIDENNLTLEHSNSDSQINFTSFKAAFLYIQTTLEESELHKLVSEGDYTLEDILTVYESLCFLIGYQVDVPLFLNELKKQFFSAYDVIDAFCGFYPFGDIPNSIDWHLSKEETKSSFLFKNAVAEIFVPIIKFDYN